MMMGAMSSLTSLVEDTGFDLMELEKSLRHDLSGFLQRLSLE